MVHHKSRTIGTLVMNLWPPISNLNPLYSAVTLRAVGTAASYVPEVFSQLQSGLFSTIASANLTQDKSEDAASDGMEKEVVDGLSRTADRSASV